MKWRFALKFLLTFAVLVPLWWSTNFGDLYERLVVAVASVLSPLINGWLLAYGPDGGPVFSRGGEHLDLLVQLPALSMGLMPLTSLIVATPNQSVQRMALAILIGAALYVLVDVGIVLAYPFILDHPNSFKDTLGVFSGLVGFVVAPLGIWFVVTYRSLQPVWQLVDQEMSAGQKRPAARRA